MGKTSRFLKALFGFKPPESTHPPPSADKPTKRRWSFFKSHRDEPPHHLFDESITRLLTTPLHHHSSDQTDRPGALSSNQSITAVASAETLRAAGEVVLCMKGRITVAGEDNTPHREWAAVKIQSYFRSYLARKALRALKSLVKLQALVRGHLRRKQDTDDLRRLQALVRARASRFHTNDSPKSTVKGPPTPEKFDHVHRSRITKRIQPSMLKNNGSILYADRILETDTMKPHIRRRTLFQPDQTGFSQSLTTSQGSTVHALTGSGEVTSITAPFKYFTNEEHVSFCMAQNSLSFYANASKNGSMRAGLLTPAKSDSSRSCLSGYSDHPNYMAYTESSRAKVRSSSAPRQRPNFELPSSTKRYSVYGYGSGAQCGSNLRESFVSKAYPGSGRLDRLGMPVGGIGYRESEFSGGYWI